ncbi:UvrD-helicase domain-containing protein [bacterium]|nr:UvrD-helicase domain-containing protein [bacterium]
MENNILDNLNQQQKNAVTTTKGPLLVLAGAGSGKTKVLTSRIAYLVQNGVKPREILAVTFTNKAAREMRERLSSILGEQTVKYMWVGTFHSICGRILRQDIENYDFKSGKKLDHNFTIYDDSDCMSVVKNALKKLNMDDKVYQPKYVRTVISNAKNKMEDAYQFATFARDFKAQKIAEVFEEYENTLNNNNAIDFDDMLMLTVKLFEQNPSIREKYYSRFQHILVDEFQDTNIAQYKLINMLFTNMSDEIPESRSLCVVGDVDQSIYSWRGADYKIILGFQKDFLNTKIIKLEQNYRSTENILKAANAIIENNEERVEKVLFSQKGDGEKIKYYEAQDDSDEANFIASTIQKTCEGDYNKYAILYRTNAQSRAIEEACMASGIPYRVFGGMKFYDRQEIKDAIAYLKLIYNPHDSQSFKRIVNVPKRAIGETSISNLQKFADEHDFSLMQAIEIIEESDLNAKTQTKLKDFKELIDKLRQAVDKYSLAEFLSLVLEKTGYVRMLQAENTPEDEARIENLQELVNVASEFEPEESDNILGEFLSQVALVSDIDGMDEIANNVTLMTLHSAKGLEFPIVFLAGLEEGTFPHQRTFTSASELEEERRLMYVGVTRAEEKLYISSAKRRQTWGEYRYYNPSRFIEEIPANLIESSTSSNIESSHSTFRSAVQKIKTDSKTSNSYSKTNFDSDGYVKPSSGFGSNFVAPSRKKYENLQYNTPVKHTPNKVIVKKSLINKQKEEEKIKAFFENNKIKKMIEEKQKNELAQAKLKEAQLKQQEEEIKYFFSKGEKVFHEHLGFGEILDVIEVGESLMYTIDFGSMGKKAMDANYARLQKV